AQPAEAQSARAAHSPRRAEGKAPIPAGAAESTRAQLQEAGRAPGGASTGGETWAPTRSGKVNNSVASAFFLISSRRWLDAAVPNVLRQTARAGRGLPRQRAPTRYSGGAAPELQRCRRDGRFSCHPPESRGECRWTHRARGTSARDRRL